MSLDFCLDQQQICPHCGGVVSCDNICRHNITHNLNKMADAAGVYEAIWRPDENGYHNAYQIIGILEDGLSALHNDPEHFRQFNSPNGWGTYDNFVAFVREVLRSCQDNPDATIRVSR